MGQRYLIDSNIVIDFVALRLPQNGSNFVENIFNTAFLISVIVKIEVLGFNDLPHKIAEMEQFINMAVHLPLDEAVTRQTISLRRKYKKLKLGDAIIASTAIVYNLTLISRNIKDFKDIKELKTLDPYIL